MWIGSEIPFKTWCYYLLLQTCTKKINDKSFIYKHDLYLNHVDFVSLKNKIKLIDDSNHIHFVHNILNDIIKSGYNVILSSEKDIYSTIIR